MKKRLFNFLLVTLITLQAMAQNVLVTGKIVDQTDTPLIGVKVVVKGSTNAAITNLNGEFDLMASKNAILVFSYIGMKSQEQTFVGTPMRVVMKEDSEALDEVVVIGYQTIKKSDLTGAISVFRPSKMKNSVVTGTVADALSSVPGLFVRSSGAPGSEGFVEVRGTSTFGSGNPLYVVDGITLSGSANRDFNFSDIESIQVLKDASAAAIYGSRAANGVIILTTKHGKEGEMKIDFSGKLSYQWNPRYNLSDRDQWIKLNDLAFTNAGKPLANHFDGNTDWQDETFKTGVIQDYNLSLSGGGKMSSYFVSSNYQTNSGTTIGSDSKRITFRANTDSKRDFSKNVSVKIGENIIISNYSVNGLNTNPFVDVFRMLPTISVYDENNRGGYGFGDGVRDVTFGINPVAKEDLTVTKNSNLRLRGNTFAEFELFKQLKYRINFGLDYSADNYSHLQKDGLWTYNQPINPTSLTKNKANSYSIVVDNTLEWKRTFGKHDFAVVAGTSYSTTSYEKLWGTKNDLLMTGNSYFDQLDAALNGPKTGSYRDLSKLYSVFSRVNYTYDNKYLLSFTIRRDESSKFGPDFRTGVFPSYSGAWRISEEDFFDVSWIDDLKIRANYGVLGSSNIGVWDWVPYIDTFPQVVFGNDQSIQTGMTQVKLVNKDLKWEKLHQMNLGVDAVLFNHRLNVSVDYFIKETEDILTPMEILKTTGNNGGNPMVNAATLKNSGFELTLNWKDNINSFKYGVGLSGSYLKNEVKKLGYDRDPSVPFDSGNTRTYVGRPIGEWYLVKTQGIFRSDEDVLAHVNSQGTLIQPNAEPGDVRYVDYNDDGKITDQDRQYCGQTIPKYHFSFDLNAAFKGLDFMVQFDSSFGNKIFNGPKQTMERFHDNSNYLASYDAFDLVSNPNGLDPRPLYGDARNILGYDNRFLETGNYIKMTQISLGYNLQKNQLGNMAESVRIFISGQNLLTITGYSGLDPAFVNGNIWSRSMDGGTFPNPYSITFGAQISF